MQVLRRIPLGGSRAVRLGFALLAMTAALCATAVSAVARNHEVEIVTQGSFPSEVPTNTHYFHKIQEAVEATKKNAWVLIEPGEYLEAVYVGPPHSDIHIRGMNRNTVVLNGQHQKGNGIWMHDVNNVWVENLTVHDFDEGAGCGDESCGNEIWWSGATEGRPDHVGAHGWYGSYLTAYDTGLEGGYGIFANHETEGEWNHIYSSGFNDSGIYIGACQECKAHVKNATIEYNAVGYSGSNSGGTLTIEDSKFAHNSEGIVPNGENPGDPPPPNDGECNRKNSEHPNPTPHFTTTHIERCEIFRKNLITENDNLSVPANGSTDKAPFGAGIELPGTYAEDIEENTITDNPSDGIMGFEYPNPFPPEADTIYFELAGNRIANNTFSGNGYLTLEHPGAGDIFLQGGLFGSKKSQSTDNCIGTGSEANTFSNVSFPSQTELETTFSCANNTTPNPNQGFGAIEYILENQYISEHDRTPENQPAPGPQETMPEPCEYVPANPLCPNGEGGGYGPRHRSHKG